MRISFSSAAKGAPEMAFWPLAASILVYSISPSRVNLVILFLVMFAASMTHLLMRQVQNLLDADAGKSPAQIRRENRRNRRKNSKSDFGEKFWNLWRGMMELLPDSTLAKSIIGGCLLLNLLAGVYFWIKLSNRLLSYSEPSVALVGVIALPYVYFSVIISVVVWKML
ncbi:hypothetical protein [Halorubellus litoreus]|uniref:Yip1 domain-containing protein n=1 Tax=Halorubellus litoreus TaxID=755308 RepID=A0ABD5VIJ5_9EURY